MTRYHFPASSPDRQSEALTSSAIELPSVALEGRITHNMDFSSPSPPPQPSTTQAEDEQHGSTAALQSERKQQENKIKNYLKANIQKSSSDWEFCVFTGQQGVTKALRT